MRNFCYSEPCGVEVARGVFIRFLLALKATLSSGYKRALQQAERVFMWYPLKALPKRNPHKSVR